MTNKEILKKYRAKFNLTQVQLGEKMNLNRVVINKIENDRYKISDVIQYKIDFLKEELDKGENRGC